MTKLQINNLTNGQKVEVREAVVDMLKVADKLLDVSESVASAYFNIDVFGHSVQISIANGVYVELDFSPAEYAEIHDYKHEQQIDVDEFEEIDNWDYFTLRDFNFSDQMWLHIAIIGIGKNMDYVTVKIDGYKI